MNKNKYIYISFTIFTVLYSCTLNQENTKPNIVFILADDQRYNTIHALGNNDIKTPNLDYLVDCGISFTNAYIMGGSSPAVCAPSRASLLTGRHLYNIKKESMWDYPIDSGHVMFPELFRKHGYITFGTGKQHNGTEAFQRAFSDGNHLFFGGMHDHWSTPVHNYSKDGKYPDSTAVIYNKFSSTLFTDAAVEFIDNHASKKKPFFVYVAYTAPHDPFMAPNDYIKKYHMDSMQLSDNVMARHPFDNGELDIRPFYLDSGEIVKWPLTNINVKEYLRDYYAMITQMDNQIGRIITSIKKNGFLDNTIFVFASDNGLSVGQHGLMHKQNLYEHSIKIPLVIAYPSLPQGELRQQLCYLHDIYPTLCELVGLPVPSSVQSKSLLSVIVEPEHAHRTHLWFAYRYLHRGVRNHRYKLIEYVVEDNHIKTQLFDLQEDPMELTNFANDSLYLDKLKNLREELFRWQSDLADTTRQGKKFWSGFEKSFDNYRKDN